MHALAPFLLLLSSVFIPLDGVILARLAGQINAAVRVTERPVNCTAVVIWFTVVVFYHAMANFAPAWGAAMPTLVWTFVLTFLLIFVLAKLTSDSAKKA